MREKLVPIASVIYLSLTQAACGSQPQEMTGSDPIATRKPTATSVSRRIFPPSRELYQRDQVIGSDSAEQAAREFIEALIKRDANKAVSFLAPDTDPRSYQDLTTEAFSVLRCEINQIQTAANQAIVTFTKPCGETDNRTGGGRFRTARIDVGIKEDQNKYYVDLSNTRAIPSSIKVDVHVDIRPVRPSTPNPIPAARP